MLKINEEKFIVLHAQGIGDHELAEKFNCALQTVSQYRKKLNLPKNDTQNLPWYFNEEISYIIQSYYNERFSDIKIVKQMRRNEGIEIKLSHIKHWRKIKKLQEANNQTLENMDIKGKDSLYCDTTFLESFIGKKLDKKECK
jgi:hypothetical protein